MTSRAVIGWLVFVVSAAFFKMEFFESSESLGGRPRREMGLIFATASLIRFHSDSELIFFANYY